VHTHPPRPAQVVKRLAQGEARALGALDDLLAGLDVRDDAAVLLDQALSPALGFLRTGGADEKTAAATLLGTITGDWQLNLVATRAVCSHR